MTLDVQHELEGVGIEPAEIAVLVEHAARSHAMLDPDEPAPSTQPERWIQLALIISGARRYAHVVTRLLDRIEPALTELTAYDAARYWHLRGLLAWRSDASAFGAIRALNAAMRLLVGDGSVRARRYRARVHDTFGQLMHQHGMLLDARQELERALALRGDDRFGEAITRGNLGRLYMNLGDYEQAAENLRIDLEILDEMTGVPDTIRAQLLSHLAECRLQCGALDEAARQFEASLALAGSDAVAVAFARIGLARVALRREDAAAARATYEELAAAFATTPPHATLYAATTRLGADAYLALERYDEALDLYQVTLRLLGSTGGSSPMEYADVYRSVAMALEAKHHRDESARNLRFALRHLDGTAAERLRHEVEEDLKRASRDSWLLHAAGRFIGQHHIERVLASAGGRTSSSTQRVAVLFSDIRGFTSLSERLATEEIVEFLNDYLTHMTRCIERCGGTVDKFIGDAVMATFPLDAHKRSGAIEAALAMREELDRLNRFLRPEVGALAIGVGIHGGDVVAGLIGSPQKRELTVIGDVVNTASRLESMTKRLGATTLVTDALEADPARYLVRPLGRYAPKGKSEGIAVFDVVGVRDHSPASRAMLAEISEVEGALGVLAARDFVAAKRRFEALEAATRHSPRAAGYHFLAQQAEQLATVSLPSGWAGEISLADK